MKTIIEQNNETLAFLRNQDFSKAIESSSAALKCHRSLQCLAADSEDGCDEYAYDCLDQCMLLAELDVPKTEANEGFIYKHGIMLPSNAVTGSDATTAILICRKVSVHKCRMRSCTIVSDRPEYF
mmetsp:Transcript_16210/g.39628  ORF Transcript_16210/g.39628 Transcript_16210/m.39628 type:complete len:125 (-) Transcript_16210:525-899(-)|eukprot:CAMPEP_0113621222 /NCGR_PEP_ID=MMETSP0017_2-20120614/10837_1 /TAXON_ID=2856 /ORGANISM="Cylindrotheca closterium" /LENGTH=124 /DNA_ID=CAMNT_0000530947 /DNA_START=112 /DNA_END=486 /DNA_ORIENTATION=- /assembly_acc=CAM_ASM_000147